MLALIKKVARSSHLTRAAAPMPPSNAAVCASAEKHCLCVAAVLQALLERLKTLKEVNMEFTIVDGRTFVTGHPHAMIR
jgi:hypothetical protein